ncbi:hypothetical protein F5Y18DRAFT_117245 [Xylariaceae sp. FL1019]|nr:hypothetical protein F5Y18DRAFT_117245 [Xylariaceae sp. FL1019]
MEGQPRNPPQSARSKMNYACEACRAAKTKCQPGPQTGICKRCSEFKRECIFRTGPRTRRPKNARLDTVETAALPPPPGPSKTFSIDFDMPGMEEPIVDFEELRNQHELHLQNLVLDDDEYDGIPDQDDEDRPGRASGNKPFSFSDMTTSPSLSRSETSSLWNGSTGSSKRSKLVHDMSIKPRFNLDSASRLLPLFQKMLPHVPLMVLPADSDVRTLARAKPFVLLAILATTSSSSSLQGYSLYDEEFRKVLGLKFVAGAERSIELLQGLLIYCSWYPFHLRPKNKQLFQYLRMCVDIVRDLELDEESDLSLSSMSPERQSRRLEEIRSLLSCFYAISAFSTVWNKSTTLRYSSQIARCADALEQHSELEQDHHLVWLVRIQYVYSEISEARRSFDSGLRDQQSEMQRDIIRAGLESQFHDYETRMVEKCISSSSITLSTLMTHAYLLAPPLFRSCRPSAKETQEPVRNDCLLLAAHKIRAFFEFFAALPSEELSGLAGADFGRVILAVIIGYRLSFPLSRLCYDYDVAQGRTIVNFAAILHRLCEPNVEPVVDADGKVKGKTNEPESENAKHAKRTDAVTAFKIVLQSVKDKFEEKSKSMEHAAAISAEVYTNTEGRGLCPMLNGNMQEYIPLWAGQQRDVMAGSYATSQTDTSNLLTDPLSGQAIDLGPDFVGPTASGVAIETLTDRPIVYSDLWSTMTMGWGLGDLGEFNMDDVDTTGVFGDLLGA